METRAANPVCVDTPPDLRVTPATDPERLADAIDGALVRLAMSIERVDDFDAPSRALGTSRRIVLTTLAGHLDRVTAALHGPRLRGGRAPADPRDAAAIASGGRLAFAVAIGLRRQRFAEAFEHASERDIDPGELRDDLDALLARVEIAHVSLDADYDLPDLPPLSLSACARVSEAAERLRAALPPDPRIRPTARRRPGIASPRGRRSS